MGLDTLIEDVFDHHRVDVQLIFGIGTSCSRHCGRISLVYHDMAGQGQTMESWKTNGRMEDLI